MKQELSIDEPIEQKNVDLKIVENEDRYHLEWLDFKDRVLKSGSEVKDEIKNGDVISEGNFKERMRILGESEYLNEEDIPLGLLIRNPEENTKTWMSLGEMEKGRYLRVSGQNLSRYINPYTSVRLLYRGIIPYENYLILSNLLPLCLHQESNLKLAFCKSGTFITRKLEEF